MESNRRDFLGLAVASGITSMSLGAGNATAAIARGTNSTYHNVKDYGVFGDGITDDTTAIQNLINSLGEIGGTIYFPKGIYLVSPKGVENSCLYFYHPVQLIGDGAYRSVILPSNLVTPTTQILVFSPSESHVDAQLSTSIENLMIGDPSQYYRRGLNAILCKTLRKNQNLAKFTMKNVLVTQGNGNAFYHINNGDKVTGNENGGLYGTLIDNCILAGGIRLDSSGDSNVIRNCIISGRQVGIHANLVPGANMLSIIDNNITSFQGAIKIESGPRCNILRNNIENNAAPGARDFNDGAVINISGMIGVMFGGVIGENLISFFGSSDASMGLRVANCRGLNVQNNVFVSDKAKTTGIKVEYDCFDVIIRSQTYNENFSEKIVDFGNGTIGTTKQLKLLNSWNNYDTLNHGNVTARKTPDGLIYLNGQIKNSITSLGTIICQLPPGFRPSKAYSFMVASGNNINTYAFGSILVDVEGTVFYSTGSTNMISLNGIVFPAANFGDANSAE